MEDHKHFLKKCISLAEQGMGYVAPNPMVGSVIVCEGEIIGEGWHKAYGKEHAEVNAVNDVLRRYPDGAEKLKKSTLYVNLEPCSHYGKTPPCADMIIINGIPRVVTGSSDTNPLVAGKGIEKLRNAGVEVIEKVFEDECRSLNKRFYTFHEKNRPYLVLKWAQTRDGFISKLPVPEVRSQNVISGEDANWLTHVWRAQEQAIMVGSNTVKVDDPQLNVRHAEGKDPVRIILDRNMDLTDYRVYCHPGNGLIVFTEIRDPKQYCTRDWVKYISIPFNDRLPYRIAEELHRENIQSVLIEGGRKLLQTFIDVNLFDEIRVFHSSVTFGNGVRAPLLALDPDEELKIGSDILKIYRSS